MINKGQKPNLRGEARRKMLRKACSFIGMSYKTMTGYVLAVRNGHRYGFDFEEHFEAGVGSLRRFNREHRALSDQDDNESEH